MEIDLGKLPFDIDFHPSEQLVTAGLITGDLVLYHFSPLLSSSLPCIAEFNFHPILSGSPDCSILATDVETGSVVARVENAHEAAINRLVNLTEATIATGDDNGCIKVWDTRQRSCCNTFNTHEEYISDMTFASDSMKLLATSGDGTLSVCNLRSNKVQTRSEFSEDELLSVVIMKNGRKVICGTQTGTLLLYSWGFFKDCSDRFVDLSPNSVDVLLKLDEDTIITGSENGLISLVGILPNRIIRPLAEHSEYPIEGLAFSHDRKHLGSISHDQTLKLWDLNELLDDSTNAPPSQAAAEGSDSDEMDVDMEDTPKSKKGTKTRNAGKGDSTSAANFFAGL
ncbi:hypothetical protein CDL15_Pgr013724 [Punica granatum]|uniref:Uncharacterized protein n=1 Tax=Punica granatum TaxID=22663 RepID=A0A218W105_PUNGR|nr:hypothetical protein CDL15_Pgr013724 [Punica granatum]